MPEIITEATAAIVEKATESGKPGRLLIGLISPGQGSSGFYSKEVVEAAGKDKVFPKGTHMYLDHPTESENVERPERSVKDLAAVLTEDAYWNAELSTLVGEAEVFGPYAESILAMKDHIGVSIRASAEVEEAPSGRQIKKLVSSESVDFVTKAGRGGSILAVLESARPVVNARAIANGVEESTVNDRREALSELLRETHGDKTPDNRVWVWLKDFDDDVAYFAIEGGPNAGMYSQTYTTGTDGLPNALTGSLTEVRQVTKYVPVNPAGQSITTTESAKEDNMGTIQIEESVHTDALEKAGRVPTLESERDTAITDRDEARAELAEARSEVRNERVARIIAEADVEFDDLQVAGLKASAPVDESGVLDVEAFTKTVSEAAARLKEAAGAGSIKGFGQTLTTPQEAELREANDKQRAAIFGRTIKEA